MTTRHRGWRPRLAAAMSAGLAGAIVLVLGQDTGSLSWAPGPGLSGGMPVGARGAHSSRPALPSAVAVRAPAGRGAAAALGEQARRHGHRALYPDATGGQVQLPATRGTGSTAGQQPGITAAAAGEPALRLPAWRALLESRWQQRLATVTELSLAYHDAADRSRGEHRAGGQAGARQLRRLMREAVAARRALSDTEEALARLSAGRFGSCEQCAAAIPAAQLTRAPEARYCTRCAEAPAEKPGRPRWPVTACGSA